MPTPLGRKTINTVTIAGVSALARPGAAAPPVIMLHDIDGRAISFRPLLKRWPMGRMLIAWDQPGYGTSTPCEAPNPSIRDYSQALERFRHGLGIATIDLVGHGFGGLVAAAYAREHTGRVRRLALLAPAHGMQMEATDAATGLPIDLARRIAEVGSRDAAVFALERAAQLVHAPSRKSPVVAALGRTAATLPLPGVTAACHALAHGDLLTELSGQRATTLIVAGSHDSISTSAAARQLTETLQKRQIDIRCIEIAGIGHAIVAEAPAMTLARLTEFLAL